MPRISALKDIDGVSEWDLTKKTITCTSIDGFQKAMQHLGWSKKSDFTWFERYRGLEQNEGVTFHIKRESNREATDKRDKVIYRVVASRKIDGKLIEHSERFGPNDSCLMNGWTLYFTDGQDIPTDWLNPGVPKQSTSCFNLTSAAAGSKTNPILVRDGEEDDDMPASANASKSVWCCPEAGCLHGCSHFTLPTVSSDQPSQVSPVGPERVIHPGELRTTADNLLDDLLRQIEW